MRAPAHWHSDSRLGQLLAPLGWLYGRAGTLRRACTTPRTVACPVVCVGNLVSGGAGKTPVALALRAWCAGRGLAAHFLTRGYGGRERGPLRVDPATHGPAAVGDEALLLAAQAPTWVARDRAAGAAAAVAAGAGLIVMDDGHQNPGLHKNLSLVVIDGDYGFGNGRVVPAGPLREPLACGLARADAVVVIGEPEGTALACLPAGLPVLRADLVPGPEAAGLAGRKVYAFAGIGRPEKFFATLRAIGCDLAGAETFADHHPFRPSELDRLLAAAAAADAVPVTTAKDAVRLDTARRSAVQVLTVAIRWRDEAALAAVLRRAGIDG